MRICKGIVLSFCIVLFVFPFISFAASGVTLTTLSGGTDILADTARVGGSGTFTDLTGLSITEGAVGNIKSGTITITAPSGFEFDTTNPATVTVTSNTSNQNTNINHLPSGTIATTVTTAGAISFTVTSQSTSARNTLTWNSVRIRPTIVVSVGSSDVVLSSTDNIVGLTLPMSVGVVSEFYVPPTLSSISITTPATKTIYKVGDILDITGLVVTGTYSDGSTKIESIDNSNLSGFDSSVAVKNQEITVTLDGKVATYNIDVNAVDSPVQEGTFIDNLTIDTDTVWDKSGNPYTIGPNVKIQNATLTIEHGVQLIVNNEYNTPMVVQGKVIIKGTKTDPVTMTSKNKNLLDGQIGFLLNNTSELNANWFVCRDIYMCVSHTEGASVYINHGNFDNTGVVVAYDMSGVVDIKNSYFKNSNAGIFGYFGRNPERGSTAFSGSKAVLRISRNHFENMVNAVFADVFGAQGLTQDNVQYVLENNTFKNISSKAGEFYTDSSLSLSVGSNYYGDASGPKSIDNPDGLGVNIYYGGGMVVQPWLAEEVFPDDGDGTPPPPKDPDPLPTCCSSVMFFPGIEGSRLYKKNILGFEDQLWEPNTASDVVDLYANTDGSSINDVYTRDIIKETNLIGNIKPLRKQIYKEFSDDLDNLVNTNKIHEWQPVPYDWRMSVDDIVDNGVVLENETKNIVAELERMAHDSDTGKVSLVGHSNGGLLIKYLVKKLEDKGEVDLIDNVVLVGSPELGTTDGILAILHGISFDSKLKYVAPQKYNRQLALNIAGAYGLLPSEKFFENSITPIILFDSSVGDTDGLIAGYGSSISTYQVLKDFILSNKDDRPIPAIDEVDIPNIGNTLTYSKAENLHNIIDNYIIPSNIHNYEVSGTGMSTDSGVIYKRNNRCIFTKLCLTGQILVPEITKTIEGDGTVLNISSAVLDGVRYYVDMNAYNKDNNVNFDHAYMMQNNSVKTLVKNIVTGVNEIVPYVIEKNSLPTIKTKHISMHSPVNIDVYDQEGRHTGLCVDPDYPDMDCVEQEIPNSSYMALGEDKYITIPNEGTYTLKLDGYDTGTFTLNIDNYENDNKTDSVEFKDVPTTTDTSSTVDLTTLPQEILLDNNNDNEPDLKVNSSSVVVDLHPKTENTKIIVSNSITQGGKPLLYSEKIIASEIPEKLSKKVVIRTKNKNAIIKRPVQFANKQINTNTNTAAAPTDSIETNIIPMSANVGSSIKFDLWKFIKRLFNY